jgi:branched-chain amino acid aminotransferase
LTATLYLNGEFVDGADASVSVFDGAFMHGAGLFETMRAENGKAFRLESHVERLRRSAEQLFVPIDRNLLPSESTLGELLDRNRLKEARLRLTVSAGSMRPDPEAEPAHPTVCVTASALTPYPRGNYERGITVVVCGYRVSTTDPVAGHKTTAYLPRLLGLREAQRAQCMEALWFTTGNHLAEGSISNVFIVNEGVLKTPPVDTPVLPGIARGVVLELAGEHGIDAEQTPLTIDDLLDADEVFLTNAIMQVMPVVRVERHDIAEGRVGAITKRLREGYRELTRRECGGR